MKALLLWLVLAQGGDIATTLAGVHRGCVEGNPVAAPRLYTALVAKASIAATLTVTLPLVHRDHPRIATATALVPALSGTAATIWNLHQLGHCR